MTDWFARFSDLDPELAAPRSLRSCAECLAFLGRAGGIILALTEDACRSLPYALLPSEANKAMRQTPHGHSSVPIVHYCSVR
jgi:hypothetical protein